MVFLDCMKSSVRNSFILVLVLVGTLGLSGCNQEEFYEKEYLEPLGKPTQDLENSDLASDFTADDKAALANAQSGSGSPDSLGDSGSNLGGSGTSGDLNQSGDNNSSGSGSSIDSSGSGSSIGSSGSGSGASCTPPLSSIATPKILSKSVKWTSYG